MQSGTLHGSSLINDYRIRKIVCEELLGLGRGTDLSSNNAAHRKASSLDCKHAGFIAPFMSEWQRLPKC